MAASDRPPYARIAAELRERIEAGELVAGERVPSAREITRGWGVAIATASRVLAELRGQGLVRAVPGVGTVVVPREPEVAAAAVPEIPTGSRRRAVPESGLTADRIVEAAIAIADTEGLAALSMRRVATAIDAAPMSLYRHVADKDDLVLQMMDGALREWQPPTDPPEGWRPRLELAARALWAAFHRHPWLAPALSLTRPQPIPSGLAYTEWVLAALDGIGLDIRTRFDMHLTLFNFIRGTAVNLESEAEAEAASGQSADDWIHTQQPAMRAIVAAGPFPLFEQLMATEYDFDLDGLFERGLRRLLDGIEGELGSGKPLSGPVGT